MMPVMRNNFDIYQQPPSGTNSQPRSRKTSQCSNKSRVMSPGGLSGPTSLSSSPGSDLDERLRAVASNGELQQHPQIQQSHRVRRISRCSEHGTSATAANVVPQSASTGSLNKFHSKLVDKLRRVLRTKDDSAIKPGRST